MYKDISMYVRGHKKFFHMIRYFTISHFPKKTSIRHTLTTKKVSSPSSRSTHRHCFSANCPSWYSLHQNKSVVSGLARGYRKKIMCSMCSLEVSASENHLWSNIQWHDKILTTSNVRSKMHFKRGRCFW